MLTGVLLGVAAGALWGLIYIAPLVVPEYNPVLVALSRFIAFGVISLPFLAVFRRELKAFSSTACSRSASALRALRSRACSWP